MVSLASKIQSSITTAANRYPQIFHFSAEKVKASVNAARVLSFGCSTGLECVTLADLYFNRPSDRILGVDISDTALEKARTENMRKIVRYEHSDDHLIDWAGPFHVIYAMSVLCLWPDTQNDEDIFGKYPFTKFEAVIDRLIGAIQVGGLLVVYNSNYYVEDIFDFDRKLVPLASSFPASYVKKFERDGKACRAYRTPEYAVFQKR